jgi:3-oxoacyl-[acyl-carrier protein] reductase
MRGAGEFSRETLSIFRFFARSIARRPRGAALGSRGAPGSSTNAATIIDSSEGKVWPAFFAPVSGFYRIVGIVNLLVFDYSIISHTAITGQPDCLPASFCREPKASALLPKDKLMDSGLQNQVVLITGVSGGIGGEVARAFLAEGARVVAHYHRGPDRAEKALKRCAGAWTLVAADLTQETDVANLFSAVEQSYGPVEILVANAGVWPPDDVPLHKMSLEQWNRTLAVDLTSVFLCMREFFRGIARHGVASPAAILIGSTAGAFGEAGHADYATAKAGLMFGLARTLKNEICRVAPRGRVNVICPGWTLTPMVDRFTAQPEKVRRVLQTVPLRKVARPADVAAAAVYLASTKLAGHVTGQILNITGGMEGRVLYSPDEIDPGKA